MRAIKQPGEKLTFPYDFAVSLGEGLTVANVIGTPSSTPRGTGANLSIVGVPTIDGTTVLVKWQGGVDGESYDTTVKVTDSAGDEHEIDGEIFVTESGFTLPKNLLSRYLTAEEYVNRYGYAETVRLTDEDKTGKVDGPKIEAALKDAADLADAYIGRRYDTPLVSTPRVVSTIVGALAREILHRARPLPEVVAAADRARQQLKDISSGAMILPVEAGDTEPTIGGNLNALTSADSSTSFKDAVSDFNVCPGAGVANWRR